MRFRKILITLMITLAVGTPLSFYGWQKADAQIPGVGSLGGIGSALGGLLGGGADPVRIVSDTSETTILNTLKTALIELSSAFTGGEISSINLKETVLDPIAWNMAKHLQQQLTGNLLKWVGGQLPGQNGQAAFVQNYGDHYLNISDTVAGEFISGDRISGLCSPEEDFKVKVRVYDNYVQARRESSGAIFQCPNEDAEDPEESPLDRMFQTALTCSDLTCASYRAQYELSIEQVNAYANERQVLDYSRGMRPQRVCRTVNEAGGATSTSCDLVNPPFLSADTVSFQLAEIPSLQLLQMDEFNEIVSNLMSNLTNQALTGLTGVLGLSGNPSYSTNVFGPDGNLSYVDALAADDIASYQTATANPIKTALKNEKDYEAMLIKILADIKSLEDKLEDDREAFPGCFDLTLTADLEQAKVNASSSLAVSSTSIAILTTLDKEYASSTTPTARGTVMSTFISWKNQGLFRTEYDNNQFQVTYLDFTFAQWVEKFRYDIAVERQSCGGTFDYTGVLTPPNSNASSTNSNSP